MPDQSPTVAPNRLMSLDVFRGMTIASMMLVNNPGDWGHVYPPFRHSEWHGWTFTDTIFPFFLWIVGVAIPFALIRRLEQGEPKGQLFAKIFRRAAILFGIGIFLNGFPFYDFIKHQPLDWSTYRIPGVLQRIALCYLVASLVVMNTGIRGQIIATAACLLGYILLMGFGSVPGFPAGDLSADGNFSHYVDRLVLGKHVYHKTWDPEGIVSTLPAISTCLFGVFVGHLLRSNRGAAEKASWIFTLGTLLMFAGQVLNLWMPINKPIWTSSYSIFMAGLASVVFGVCYWLVDVKGHQCWVKPFAIYGMNAITVFVLAGLIGRLTVKFEVQPGMVWKSYLFDHLFGWLAGIKLSQPSAPITGGFLSPEQASLCWAIMYVLLLYFVAYIFYRRKWFVRF